MAANIRRYDTSAVLSYGKLYGTSLVSRQIYNGIQNGTIRYSEINLSEGERLDVIAGQVYGEGLLYWILCAASGIGYPLQCPPGTIVKVPVLGDVVKALGA